MHACIYTYRFSLHATNSQHSLTLTIIISYTIQLTITVVGYDLPSIEERKELIDNITQMLDNIMKLFMPAVHSKPAVLLPCPLCPTLHITQDQVCSGNTIYCANASDNVVPPKYYRKFLSTKSGNLAGFKCNFTLPIYIKCINDFIAS